MTRLPLFPDADSQETHKPAHQRQDSEVDASSHVSAVRRSSLWAAYGDALGWISELTDEYGLKRRTKGAPLSKPIEWERRIGGRSGVTAQLPIGCYSDDSQLRLATGRAIRSDGFDVEAFAKVELPVWLSYALGGGKSTSSAASNLTRPRVAWFSNTFKGWANSGGNGAAMRIQPHVWSSSAPADPETFLPDVVSNAICTHSHPHGLMGAVIHALTLAHTITTRRCPSPEDLFVAIEVAARLPEFMLSEIEVRQFWLPVFERESGPFDRVWERAIHDCRQAIRIADDASTKLGTDGYAAIVEQLKLRDPERRGSGMLTAVAAVGLTWCEPRPEQALLIAANALGTDTDTIATMAGAILGITAESEPPVEVLDASLFRSESDRLAKIAQRELPPPPSHQYPDLLHWSAPRTRSDTLIRTGDGSLYVRGLGRAKAVGEPIASPKDSFMWQWIELETGQTLLIKRRRKLMSGDGETVGFPVRRSQHQVSPTSDRLGKVGSRLPSVSSRRSRDLAVQETASSRQSDPPLDLEAFLRYLEKHKDDDRRVGRAIRRVVNRGTQGQIAVFLSEMVDHLREPEAV